jgi:hypothetical protein
LDARQGTGKLSDMSFSEWVRRVLDDAAKDYEVVPGDDQPNA